MELIIKPHHLFGTFKGGEKFMKKNNNALLANAFGLAMAILWTLCALFVWLLPDFSLMITSWWMHGMDISVMGGWNLSLGSFLFGGITAVVASWITGWVLGWSWQQVGGNSRR